MCLCVELSRVCVREREGLKGGVGVEKESGGGKKRWQKKGNRQGRTGEVGVEVERDVGRERVGKG